MVNGKSTKRKNKPGFKTLGLFILSLTLPIAGQCQAQNQVNTLSPTLTLLKPGDLILRRGKGVMSDMAASFSSTDKRFSHVGILVYINGTPRVIHSIHEEEKGFDGVVTESLDNFVRDATNWSVYRLPLNQQQRQALSQKAQSYANKGIRFDSKFDLGNADKLYCTEFIWKTLSDIGQPGLIKPDTRRIGNLYISIEDTYNHANVKLIEGMQTKPKLASNP